MSFLGIRPSARAIALSLGLATLGAARPVLADEEAAKPDDFGHQGQLGLRIGIVAGYRMVLRYDSSPYCTEPDPAEGVNGQQKFCGHAAPLALNAGLSFGIFDFFEPFVWARMGFGPEEETDTEPLVMFGAGARIYTMSDSAFKIFIEPAVGLEIEGGRGTAAWQANGPAYEQDFIVHLAAGPSFDFARQFGAYLTGGITTGMLRALHSSLELELGIQGRYP